MAGFLQENELWSGLATVSLGISLCSGMSLPGSAASAMKSTFSSLSGCGVPSYFLTVFVPTSSLAQHFLPFLSSAFTEAPPALPKGLAVAAMSPLWSR